MVTRESDLERKPFPLKSNTTYDLTKKHSVSLALTWADAHTPTKLVCLPQLRLVALGPCSRRQLTQTPICSVCGIAAETRQIHMDYWVLWRKRDGTATLLRGGSSHFLLLVTEFVQLRVYLFMTRVFCRRLLQLGGHRTVSFLAWLLGISSLYYLFIFSISTDLLLSNDSYVLFSII